MGEGDNTTAKKRRAGDLDENLRDVSFSSAKNGLSAKSVSMASRTGLTKLRHREYGDVAYGVQMLHLPSLCSNLYSNLERYGVI